MRSINDGGNWSQMYVVYSSDAAGQIVKTLVRQHNIYATYTEVLIRELIREE